MIRIHTVLGARPQFIKAAALSREIQKNRDSFDETIIHSGQHFDANMSETFFEQLGLPKPLHQLKSPSKSGHGGMTGDMMATLEFIFKTEIPDLVLVYGDTNTTLAAALTAAKLHIPVVHVEAGLRSHNKNMPEEINRIVVDRISALNFAPSNLAMTNLKADGLGDTAHNVGDIMRDVIDLFTNDALLSPTVQNTLPTTVLEDGFVYTTCHRGETTDDPVLLTEFLNGINLIAREVPVIIPAHPRLISSISKFSLGGHLTRNVHLIEPVDFFSSLYLQRHAEVVLTDSGGIQKEAFYLGTPCVTFRQETEWLETVELGWNRLSRIQATDILEAVNQARKSSGELGNPYGDGQTSKRILEILKSLTWKNYFPKP